MPLLTESSNANLTYILEQKENIKMVTGDHSKKTQVMTNFIKINVHFASKLAKLINLQEKGD